MGKEAFLPNSDQLYDGFVKKARKWVKNQASSINGHFPRLNDGTMGVQIGDSATALYAKVLRPNGELVFVDLIHMSPAKDADKPLAPSQYLSSDTLREVQMAVNQVKLTLKAGRKPSVISGIRSILTRS